MYMYSSIVVVLCTHKYSPAVQISAFMQVCIFCEGTRFTHAKYRVGIEYAKQKGLKQLKYHLLPRTKGFAALAHHLKAKGD